MELTKIKFKQTEVGLIPEDWNIKSTIDCAKNGEAGIKIGPFGSALKKDLLVRQGYKVYGQENVFDRDVEIGDRFITLQHFRKLKSCELLPGDFIVSMMGTIGQCMILPEKMEQGIMDSHLLRIKLDKSVVHPDFFEHVFSSPIAMNQVKKLSVGGIMEGLSSKIVKKIQYPLPPTLTEQKAIATALSDVDELISKLENLIAKKKAIKQGAMQELLTPKNGWSTKTLKEVSTYRRGSFPQPYGLPKWYDDITGMPFVQVVDVANNRKLKPETKQKISAEGAKMSVFVKKGSVILTIQGSIGRICITQYDAYVDRTLLIFESFLEEFNKFFFMTVVHQKFEIEKEKAPGGIIKTITKEALSSFEISFPDIEEQNRIAQILSDMDVEIEALEAKKAKYQDIKQGMMQELLTGKTRLV